MIRVRVGHGQGYGQLFPESALFVLNGFSDVVNHIKNHYNIPRNRMRVFAPDGSEVTSGFVIDFKSKYRINDGDYVDVEIL